MTILQTQSEKITSAYILYLLAKAKALRILNITHLYVPVRSFMIYRKLPFLALLILSIPVEARKRDITERRSINFSKIHIDQLYFPENFLFGFAIAEQQNSGAENLPDSNWSHWETTTFPDGRPHIRDHQRSGKACDHWNLYTSDIALMKEDFQANAFRFSLAWDRIEPKAGIFSEEALQHYSDEVDALLAAGITPMITLHHFSHPQWFENMGGFEKEENIDYFVRFSKKVFEKLGSRVPLWCTINEPTIYVFQGYLDFNCVFPPAKAQGIFSSFPLAAKVLRNLMQAHTEVYKSLKGMPHGEKAQIGLVHQYLSFHPWSIFTPIECFPQWCLNEFMVDSVINFLKTGTFSYTWRFFFKESYQAPVDKSSNLPVAKQISDFVGLNYYSRVLIELKYTNLLKLQFEKALESSPDVYETMTDMEYALYPFGIYKALHHMSEIGLPLYVTENGIADHKTVKDERRVRWIKEYLKSVSLALEDGIDVRGFFYWTLMDNFEWDRGFHSTFGLYSNDTTTQKRTLKEGGRVYAHIIKTHRSGGYSSPTQDATI
jgi:beta-glucosidase